MLAMAYIEQGKVGHAPVLGDTPMADVAGLFEEDVANGEEIVWFFVSDRNGDPILVSYQDWTYFPAWEVAYNTDL